ncbi:hypothetical protein Rsub_10902 [Raphidocelis subcapitata]|uniref:GS catalytic domain-containing protein n=1 Tax=Raphidocelis subcapitata TaxID=307507 RepID=A0A2V0PD08_9CHLO|nr:hypothetical protein Rsub_10902 [Raphidocelis subcapitata]|eukprot:GBF97738.1 hypothetical protein Rsub_10902 [Raphidocelis subcapitata]
MECVPGDPHAHGFAAAVPEKPLAEYIYIVPGSFAELVSRTVALAAPRAAADALPLAEHWTERGGVLLRPRAAYPDPLRGAPHVLVLCDALAPQQAGAPHCEPPPHPLGTRAPCAEAMAAAAPHAPLFSAEQEYTALDPFTGLPPGVFSPGACHTAGFFGACSADGSGSASGSGSAEDLLRGAAALPAAGPPAWASPASIPGASPPSWGRAAGDGCGGAGLEGSYDSSDGAAAPPPLGPPAARRARLLSELHARACLKAGLRLSGARPAPGASPAAAAASYTLGPADGLEISDQIVVSRFLLARLAEELSLSVAFAPVGPPRHGAAAFAGAATAAAAGASPLRCRLEFSTAASRAPCGGLHELQRLLSRLQAAHAAHCAGFGGGGGGGGGAPFSVAVADARAAVAIPPSTLAARGGPFVDARPAGGCDPYLATTLLAAGALALPLPHAAAAALEARRRAPAAAAHAAAAPNLLRRADAAAAPAWKAVAWSAAAPAAATTAAPPSPACPFAAGAAPAARSASCLSLRSAGGRGAGIWAATGATGLDGGHSCGAAATGATSLCGGRSCGGDSRDFLVSQIRRIDRAAARAAGEGSCSGGGWSGGWESEGEGEEEDSACSPATTPADAGPLAAS